MKNPSFYHKMLFKNKLINKPRANRKSIIKIVNINEIKNWKTIEKINERRI